MKLDFKTYREHFYCDLPYNFESLINNISESNLNVLSNTDLNPNYLSSKYYKEINNYCFTKYIFISLNMSEDTFKRIKNNKIEDTFKNNKTEDTIPICDYFNVRNVL